MDSELNNDRRHTPATLAAPPCVSIVLPTYNQCQYLPRAVQSILDQSFEDFELIVVNDGSTDGTDGYLRHLTDPRLVVVEQANARLPRALNNGFNRARGTFHTWISSDNYCSKYFLEDLVMALRAHPECGMAYSDFALVDDQGRTVRIEKDKDFSYRNVLLGNPGNASFLYRRECYEEVGQYEPSLEGAEDWDMWLRIVEKFPTVHVQSTPYYYRLHERSMTETMKREIAAACRTAFHRGIERAGGFPSLERLFPALTQCRNTPEAEGVACLVFGTRLLQSEYDAADLARRYLELAFVRMQTSVEAATHLAMAYARSGRKQQAMSLAHKLQNVPIPAVREIASRLRAALDNNDTASLNDLPMLPIPEEALEPVQREQSLRKHFNPAMHAAEVQRAQLTGLLEVVACPNCGSAETAVVKPASDIVRCTACDLVFARTRRNDAGNEQRFRENSGAGRNGDGDHSQTDVVVKLHGAIETLRAGDRVLLLGPVPEAMETEVRTRGAIVASPEILYRWEEGYESRFGEPGSFALIACFDWLHDMPQPKCVVDGLRTLLREDGMLCGSVQNLLAFGFQEADDRPEWMSRNHHTVYYTPRTLRSLFIHCGFSVESVSTPLDPTDKRVREEARKRCMVEDGRTFQQACSRLESIALGDQIVFTMRKSAGASFGLPEIAVILPTYNRHDILPHCLEGFARQTLPTERFEVVIVDDGSAPTVEPIARSFEGRLNLRYVRQVNQGLSGARNTAIAAACAPLLALHDDDDVPEPDYLERCVAFHRLHPEEEAIVLARVEADPSLASYPVVEWFFRAGSDLSSFPNTDVPQDFLKFFGGTSSCKKSIFRFATYDPAIRFGYEDVDCATRLDRFLELKVYYDPAIRSRMIRSFEFPQVFLRSYREGRSHVRYYRDFPETGLKEFGQSIANPEGDIARFGAVMEQTLEFIAVQEAFVQGVDAKGDRREAEAQAALFDAYKYARSYALACGRRDAMANIDPAEGLRHLADLLERRYVPHHALPAIMRSSKLPVLLHEFRRTTPRGKDGDRVSALCFYPHNPFPPRTGADHGFLGMLAAIQTLGCDVTLFSSTLFTDKPWILRDTQEQADAYGIDILIHQATERDRDEAELYTLFGPKGYWDYKNPAGLRKAFREAAASLKPDLILVNYAWWGKLIDECAQLPAVKVIQMHDAASLNSKMQDEALRIMGDTPYVPAEVAEEALKEDTFAPLNLQMEPEEFDVYRKFDYCVAVSEKEGEAIARTVPSTTIVRIPAPIRPAAIKGEALYNGSPLFAIANNVFNQQAYCYLVRKVLPLVLEVIPEFTVDVIGDACKTLTPARGVNILGFVDDIDALYYSAPYVIAPMLGGTGQSVKILEAMLHAVPAIALRNSYQSITIEDGRNGFIVSDAREFAEAMIRLYRDRRECKRLGGAAREYILDHFSPDVLASAMRPVIDRTRAEREGRRAGIIAHAKHVDPPQKQLSLAAVSIPIGPRMSRIHPGIMLAQCSLDAYTEFQKFLDILPPFHVHMGGLAEAALLLSTFYDAEPSRVVLSFSAVPEHTNAFFEQFDGLAHVYCLPQPTTALVSWALRRQLGLHPSCLGMGVTPVGLHSNEWAGTVNIEGRYGVRLLPDWIKRFRQSGEGLLRIVVQPSVNGIGSIGGRRAGIDQEFWPLVMQLLSEYRAEITILGDPAEDHRIPSEKNARDCRGESVLSQIRAIASSDLFIGVRSWELTIAALAGIPVALLDKAEEKASDELSGLADNVFVRPWKNITLVKDFAKLSGWFHRQSDLDQELHVVRSLVERSDFNGALEIIDTLQQRYRGDARGNACSEGLDWLSGKCLLQLKRLDEAKDAFARALEANPSSSRACAGLGEVFSLMGLKEEAKTMYEWAVVNDPGNEDAVAGLARVNAACGFDGPDNSILRGREAVAGVSAQSE